MSLLQMLQQLRSDGFIWITLYFLGSLILTIHTKWVLSRLHFDFPWLLSAIHIGLSGLGSYMCVRYWRLNKPVIHTPERDHSRHKGSDEAHSEPINSSSLSMEQTPETNALSVSDHVKLILFSLLYTVNISISNVSLNYVSLTIHQIIRSTNPLFTIALEFIIFHKISSLWIHASLCPVVVGVCLATLGEYETTTNFDFFGLFLTFLGVLLSAMKGIATNWLMVGSLKLHPLVLISKIAPLCLIQCFIYAWVFGEFTGFMALSRQLYDSSSFGKDLVALYMKLLMNGFFAFFLNWVSFTANKKTSALTMTVAGNVKQAISILLAVYVFATPLTLKNSLGILITLLGGAWYR